MSAYLPHSHPPSILPVVDSVTHWVHSAEKSHGINAICWQVVALVSTPCVLAIWGGDNDRVAGTMGWLEQGLVQFSTLVQKLWEIEWANHIKSPPHLSRNSWNRMGQSYKSTSTLVQKLWEQNGPDMKAPPHLSRNSGNKQNGPVTWEYKLIYVYTIAKIYESLKL